MTQSVAQRWWNLTTNLLVTGIVVVFGLTLGREMLQWWRTDPDAVPAAVALIAPHSPSDDSPQIIRFGNVGADFQRFVVRGDRQAAAEAMRVQAVTLGGYRTDADLPPLTAEESAAIEAVRDQQPALEFEDVDAANTASPETKKRGTAKLYELEAPLPMVMVVGANRRVLSWALAFPRSPSNADEGESWAVFAWTPARGSSSIAATDLPDFPHGKRILSLSSPQGAGLTLIQGAGSLSAWKETAEAWTRREGLRVTHEWSQVREVWSLTARDEKGAEYEFELTATGPNRMRAFVEIRTATATPTTIEPSNSTGDAKQTTGR